MGAAVLILVLVAVVSTRTEAQCNMTDWSEWGACQYSSTTPGHSFDTKARMARFDSGRFVQARLMKIKEEQFSKPVYERTESRTDGPVKCTNVCEIHPDHGPCTEIHEMWYYNSRTRTCKTFKYGGCEGNANRFATRDQCESACNKSSSETVGIFPCHNVDQLSFINITDLGYDHAVVDDPRPRLNDIWGWSDEKEGEEYVIVGLTGGSSFVRVTDPEHPEVLGVLYTVDVVAHWRDMKVVNDHVYIVADGGRVNRHGMQIFDLRQLRGLTADANRVFQHTAHWNDFGNAHNVVSNPETNTVYVVGSYSYGGYPNVCSGGLYMLDVTKPAKPVLVGCFGDDGYTHDAQCLIYRGPDKRYNGSEICFSFNEDTFTIVDVTNKSNAQVVSRMGYDGSAYTHQGWCSEDMTLLLMDDEVDEMHAARNPEASSQRTRTYIWDITNLQRPVLKNIYHSTQDSIDHNQYVLGDYTYQSNYKAGFRLLKILPEDFSLREVAYFDVHPTGTDARFGGSWSNYPYLKSGAVAVTSMEYGLFLLKPNWAKIEESTKPYGLSTRKRTALGHDEDSPPYVDMSCAGLEELILC